MRRSVARFVSVRSTAPRKVIGGDFWSVGGGGYKDRVSVPFVLDSPLLLPASTENRAILQCCEISAHEER